MAKTRQRSRLVVGGGRAGGFPPGKPGDISLDIDAATRPHVVGDIAFAPLRSMTFSAVLFERVPFMSFTGPNLQALGEAARVLQPGGSLSIETGIVAPMLEIHAGLRGAGFANIVGTITSIGSRLIEAVLGGI